MSTENPQPPEGELPTLIPQATPTPPPVPPPAPEPPAPVPPAAAVPPAAYPPPAAPAYPPPAYAPPANSYQAAPQNGLGTAALILGILQFFCLGLIGTVLAIIFGRMGMKKAEQGLATNGGQAKAGFWLGIIGLILFVVGILIWVILVATGVANGNIEVNTT